MLAVVRARFYALEEQQRHPFLLPAFALELLTDRGELLRGMGLLLRDGLLLPQPGLEFHVGSAELQLLFGEDVLGTGQLFLNFLHISRALGSFLREDPGELQVKVGSGLHVRSRSLPHWNLTGAPWNLTGAP